MVTEVISPIPCDDCGLMYQRGRSHTCPGQGQRRYSLPEVERLRKYAAHIFLFGVDYWPSGDCFSSRSYKEPEKAAAVDAHVRTLMAAGVDPADCVIKSAPPTPSNGGGE